MKESPIFPFKDLDLLLNDICCRFLINVPTEEQNSAQRLGFQIEQAHWFYEDFLREADPSLPFMTLKTFMAQIYTFCPELGGGFAKGCPTQPYVDFIDYKLKVPVCGAIILNPELDKCLLVKGYANKATYGFPKGKIDSGEADDLCAAREVLEEIGFDIGPYIKPDAFLEIEHKFQRIKLFTVPCIPEDIEFRPLTRKEIGRIEWFPIHWLPTVDNPKSCEFLSNNVGKLYLVSQFIRPLNKWIDKYKRTPQYKIDLERSKYIRSRPTEETEQQLEAVSSPSPPPPHKIYTPTPWNDFKFDMDLIMQSFDSVFV